MPLIAALVFVVSFAFYLSTFTSVAVFIDVPSLIFVAGAYALVLIASKNSRSFYHGLKIMVSSKFAPSSEMLDDAITAFTLLLKSTPWICIAGMIVGLVALLSKIDQPSTIGPNMALAILSVFYCALLSITLLLPGVALLKKVKRDL